MQQAIAQRQWVLGGAGPGTTVGAAAGRVVAAAAWASRGILVESFEPGASAAHFIRRHTPFRADIEAPGLDTTFACRSKHTFVHTDLHPGWHSRCTGM